MTNNLTSKNLNNVTYSINIKAAAFECCNNHILKVSNSISQFLNFCGCDFSDFS